MLRLAAVLFALACAATAQGAPQKVLRVPFLIAETNFDPAFVSDTYSATVNDEIFESPYTYDMLARPYKVKPQTAEAMPEVTEGGRVYTIRIRKGIYYSDDPAFKGAKRELVAKDYDFAIRRIMDPEVKSANTWLVEGRIEGLDALAEAKKKGPRPDYYDAPIAGLKTLDSHTLQVRLTKPDFNFVYVLTLSTLGAQAREVVEMYGSDIGAHPVGTGPFILKDWKRSSKIVLEKNPNFREAYYEAEPAPDDAISQKLYAQMKGKRIPQLDRVEIYVIEETQPRWLAFLNSEIDWINVPTEFKNQALPDNKLAPWLEKRRIKYIPSVDADITYLYYNMKDPVVGGYTPEKVALRRAIGLAFDMDSEIALLRNNVAIEAQSPLPPGILGYDPKFYVGRSYDPAKAKALLDMFGYVDRDGDGWREQPDGKPLVFEYNTDPSQLSRLYTQLWKKCMDAIGIKMVVDVAKWPDHRKKSKLGKLQTWHLAWNGDFPDGENFYQLLYGPNCGTSNDGCFQLPEFDRLYEKAASMPPSDERVKIYQQMARLIAVYAPWKLGVHRLRNQLIQPWVLGWRKHQFIHDAYRYVDIDLETRAKYLK
ncbi:ABC transporter substrate-binding protein [Usitatibacter palustris]|uniref:Heme-binding protein A n=1 Tax=Usitatibacter palustris TaxID=2732487 RepID=A0A6M4H8V6_9PROT|nr:ABC transporter substrate-binding protein [Usitatibacter palustris]QJR15645.1 Heme-binding protein A [Usitatibacter palustris]